MINFDLFAWTAMVLGVAHVLMGPDHYIPFIALSRAHNWKVKKMVWITFVCGLAHICISVLIGCLGIYFQAVLRQLELIESFRSEWAGYFLIAFGLVYSVWGMKQVFRKDSALKEANPRNFLWFYFLIFIFGPCEPAIPLLMYPDVSVALWSTFLFSVSTIGTMLSVVLIGTYGFSSSKLAFLGRYSHLLAGISILICSFFKGTV